MITILLDSSTTDLCVGIAKDNVIVDSIKYFAWQEQSEYMIPEIDKLLKNNNLKKEDISEVVVTIGPGSYTGVRIAVTIAKIMGVCLEIPVYTISSLRVLKDKNNPSICLINARGNRSYFGVFEGDKIIVNDTIVNNDDVLKYVNDHPTYSICGDTKYLSIASINNDIFAEMINLKNVMSPVKDNLSIKPIYLKD